MTNSKKRVAKDMITPRRAEIDVPNKKTKLVRPEPVHVKQIGMFHRSRGHLSVPFTFRYSTETKQKAVHQNSLAPMLVPLQLPKKKIPKKLPPTK